MARHKDIDRASALLEGTQGWSITGYQRSGKRRNKRSYIYHQKGYCKKLKCECMGSSDCSSYCD